MRGYPVLPVKFGTLLPSEDRARDLIVQGEPLFRKALSELEGRTQVEVVVLWDTGDVIRELAGDGRVQDLKARLESSPTNDTAEARVALGKLVYELMEERRAALRDSLGPELSAGAADAIAHTCLDDGMVLNLALLVDREARESLNRLLDDLDRRFESRFTFRCVGPLPPYSFASVEVKAPTFDEVDSARRLLGLAESAARQEIKKAYHRLAAQAHPDLDPSNPEAESRMSELANAYAFLTEYAESASTCAGSPAAVFDRVTVDRTLMISIRRQESAA
jgi:DnaJ-domain-containing protein 1